MKKTTTFIPLLLALLTLSSFPASAQIGTDEFGTQNYNRILSGLGIAASFASIPHQDAFHQADDGSIEMWIYPTSLSTNPKVLISKGATVNVSFQWSISNIDSRMIFRIGTNDYVNSSGVQIPVNTWTHVAVTWSGGPIFNVRFYVNGALSGSLVSSAAVWNVNTDAIRIGGSQANPSNFFQGNIDEVRFWSTALSLAQIQGNRFIGLGDATGANNGGAITGAANYIGLLSSWTFNSAGSVCYDYISGYNGSYIGSAASVAVTSGNPLPYNFALKFGGAGTDNIRIPNSAVFNQTTSGTLELWFKPVSFSTEQILVSKGATPSTISFILGVVASTGRLYFGSGTSIAINSTGNPLTLNQWNHVAVTWIQIGSNMEIRFYRNGKLNGTPSTVAFNFPTNAEPVWVGNSAVYNLPARGWIDEVRLWDPQLTEAQINTYMFVSCRSFTSGALICAYNFDGNLINFTSYSGLSGSFNNGGNNNCRFSGFTNDSVPGAFSTFYIAHTTVINRTGSPNPFPNGFALRTPFLNIPDNYPPGVSDSITIYNPAVPVSSIEVFLSIKHTFVGDLSISLKAPNGQIRNIIANNGASADNVLSFFNDNFPDVITTPAYIAPWGFVKPISIFGNFGGATVNGTWTIRCVDGVGGDAGVLEGWGIRFNNVVSAESAGGYVPGRFNLYQNYPNPFNPVTRIRFDLPKDANVNLKVFDLLGREVFLLTDNFYRAGSYTIDFDASNLSTGTYFFRISAGDYSDTKKMVLIK